MAFTAKMQLPILPRGVYGYTQPRQCVGVEIRCGEGAFAAG